MGRIIDISTNFKPHTELKLYDVLGIDKENAKAIDPEAYIAEMDRNGVAMTGIISNTVQNGVKGELLMTHADEVYPVLQKYPDRFFGWVGINPLGGMETLRYIEYAVKELGFKGVHVYPHWFGVPINDRTYWPIYAKCCELDVPITLQVGRQSPRSGGKLCARPEWIEDAAFDFPELTLIGLHIGVPYDFEMTSAAMCHENVYIIADAHPPSTWTQHFIDYCAGRGFATMDGDKKVMWGTDWPVQTITQSLKELRELDIPPAAMENLMGETAIKVLKLDVSAA